jgi:hypothetical protein
MDYLGDEFMQSFSAKLPEFFNFYTQWWLWDKALNQSAAPDARELLYWYSMQIFATNSIESFSKNLPASVKNAVEPRVKEIEKQMKEPFSQKKE